MKLGLMLVGLAILAVVLGSCCVPNMFSDERGNDGSANLPGFHNQGQGQGT